MNLTGQIPSNFAAMTSCDMEYLKDHGPAFVASVAKAGNNCHVHTVNPSLSYARLADILNIGFQKLKISEGVTQTMNALGLFMTRLPIKPTLLIEQALAA